MRKFSNQYAKTQLELEQIRAACKISQEILQQLVGLVGVGRAAGEIDELANKLCEQYQVKPAFKNYAPRGLPPFPYAASVCLNDEVVHGFSTKEKIMQTGDIVTLDFGIVYQGWYTDHCVSVGVGELAAEDMRLLQTAKLAVSSAIPQAVAGKRTGDIGNAMEQVALLAGYDVIKHYIGHGIGRSLHEAPEVPAYGYPDQGAKLEPGMILCLEAQVVSGTDEITTDSDQWTVRTADGKKCAWFEYMVLVGEKSAEVLTDTRSWPLMAG